MEDSLDIFLEGLSLIVSEKRRLPLKGEKVRGFDVGTYWTRVRNWNYKKKLSAAVVKILKAIDPLVANALTIKRRISPSEWVLILARFEEKEGRMPLPGEVTEDGYPIGDWWNNRKRRHRNNPHGIHYENLMSSSSHAEEALRHGFTRRSMAFFNGLRDHAFQESSLPSFSYVRKRDGLPLGRWWMYQKRRYRQGKMPEKWRDYLVSLHPLVKEAFEKIDVERRHREIDDMFGVPRKRAYGEI